MRYPEWTGQIPKIIVYTHGGDRLFHFYSLIVFQGNRQLQRPFDFYLRESDLGTPLAPIDLESDEILEAYFSYSKTRYLMQRFQETDIEFWSNRLGTLNISD